MTFRGDPSTLFMKLENEPFFFHGAAFLASSEYLLGVADPESGRGGAESTWRSPAEKLADCLKDGLVICSPGELCERGSGPGRRNAFW